MRFIRLQNAALGMSLLAVMGLVANMAAPVALGQTNTTGDVAGIVADSSGAIVPGATLRLTSLATGATRSTTSNSVGDYRFSQLPPGRYTLETSAVGFEKAKQTLDVSAGAISPANVGLIVGKTSWISPSRCASSAAAGVNQPRSTHSSPSIRGSWPAGSAARKK